MMLHVPEVLSGELLTQLRDALQASSVDVGVVARRRDLGPAGHSAEAKPAIDRRHHCRWQWGAEITAALEHHPLFVSAALPRHILPPLFNCYDGGGHYGNHVDNAIQRDANRPIKVRTDVSVTVFISQPDEYDGGELIIEDTYGAHEVKLPAGDAILYPSTSLHRVEPVTRGCDSLPSLGCRA